LKSVKISTHRLELVAATLDHIYAEIEAPERLASLLGATVGPGWPPGEYDRGAQEFFRDRLREGGSGAIGWYNWYAIRRGGHDEASVLIGAGGYVGPPNGDGVVEIGFSMMPHWRGMGYAMEMVEELIANALADPRVRTVVARTSKENPASCRVLNKAGFRCIGGSEEPGGVCFEVLRDPPPASQRNDSGME
jgi:[ribosomal protein S5]-alanine N-acetyltransferase